MDLRLNKAFQSAVVEKQLNGCGGIIIDRSGDVLWQGAFGSVDAGDASAQAYTTRTPFTIYSCTKLITSVVALQLLEEGKLSLSDPVEKFDPDFAKLQVLDGYDEEEKPKYRAPKTKATILHLMTHTTGLAYDFFEEDMLKWRMAVDSPPASTMNVSTKEIFSPPFLFEPGQEHCYGLNTDRLGFVIEAIEGKKLWEVVQDRIVKPLKMNDTTDKFDETKPRMVLHLRHEGGLLTALPEAKPLEAPEVRGGGEFLVSTIDDYSSFLLTLLNHGEHPKLKVRILGEDTVAKYLFQDQVSKVCSPANVGHFKSSIAYLTNPGEFLPGTKKTFSAGLLVNLENTPAGRKAGSGAWAGLANTYYFVDPVGGKLAMFNSSLFPFFDPTSLHLFDEMERTAYGH